MASAAGLAEECARARLAAMHALVESGRFDEAESEGLRARELLVSLDRSDLVARAEINLGILHQRQGRLDEARTRFDAAAPALASEPLILAQLQNNRAEVLLRLYDFEGAGHDFAASHLANMAAGASVNASIALGNLADLEARRGECGAALRSFESAIATLAGTSSDTHVLRLRAERAEVMDSVGLHNAARVELASVLESLERHGLRREAARARVALGRSWQHSGSRASAQTHLLAAQAQFAGLGDDLEAARVTVDLADLALEAGEWALAESLARTALAVAGLGRVDRSRANLLLSAAAIQRGAWDESLAQADLARSTAGDVAPLVAAADLLGARASRGSGKIDQAMALARRAAASLDRLRTDLPARRFRLADSSATDAHRLVASIVLAQPRPDALLLACAMDASEGTRHDEERALAIESLSSGTDAPTNAGAEAVADAATDALVSRRDGLLADLNAIYSMVADSRASDSRQNSWRQRVATIESSLDAIEADLETRGFQATHVAPPDAAPALESMPTDTRIIRFGVVDRSLVAAVVTRDSPRVVTLCPAAEVDRLVRALLFHMRGAVASPDEAPVADGTVRRIIGAIEALALTPVLEVGGGDCFIVPSGPLSLLPPLACESITRRVGEMHLVPSLRDALRAATRQEQQEQAAQHPHSGAIREPSTMRVLVVDHDDGTLPGATGECDAIASSWSLVGASVDRLSGSQATVSSVIGSCRRADVVHLACHGWFSGSLEGASGLRLSDGWLTRQLVRRCRLQARVVVLSGCETGPGRAHDGLDNSPPSGLFASFLAAGAGSVVSTLWPVRDDICAFSMDLLHRMWQNGSAVSLAGSLAQVADAVRDRSPHPCHWAPLTLFERGST